MSTTTTNDTLLCYLELESDADPSPEMRRRVAEVVQRLRAAAAPNAELVDEIEGPEELEKGGARGEQERLSSLRDIFNEPMLRPVPSAPVNDADEPEADRPTRTFGVWLELASTDSDRKNLLACEAVLTAVRALTAESLAEFDVEWNGEYIGAISRGSFGRAIADGLLTPWHDRVEKPSS